MEKVELNEVSVPKSTEWCRKTGRTHIYCRGRARCQPWYKRWRWYVGDILGNFTALVLG